MTTENNDATHPGPEDQQRADSEQENHDEGHTEPRADGSAEPETTQDAVADGSRQIVTRRGVLSTAGLLAVLGLGAGSASADASGKIGTSSDPLNKLYTEELNGGVTGDTSLTNIAGSGLTIDGSGNLKTSGGGSSSSLETSGNSVTTVEVFDGGSGSAISANSDSSTPPNIINGHPSNNTGGSDVKGVTISGGGDDSGTRNAKDNTASGDFATIGGGHTNVASGVHSTVPGGEANIAGGDHSFAAGRKAQASNNNGAFVWGDSSSTKVTAGAADEVRFQATGGFVVENGNLDAQGGTVENTTSGGLTVKTNDNGDLILDPGSSSANTVKVKNRKSGSSSDNLLAVDGTNNLTESSKTVSDIGGGLEAPSGSSDGASSFDTWTEVSSTSPAFVTASAAAETNGSTTARVKLAVDEAGGTSADYSMTITQTASEHTDGTYHEGATSVLIPAGAQYQVENNSDPNGGNILHDVRESIL